mgnify:FL=1
MASEASLRDAILSATGTPPHSLSAILRTLRTSSGFATRVLETIGQHAELKVRNPDYALSQEFDDVNDFSRRWLQTVVTICELSTCSSIVASRLHVACHQFAAEERADAYRKVVVDYWERFRESAALLGVGHLFAFAEPVEGLTALFIRFAGEMPKLSDPPPEGAEANALWPYFRVPKAGQIALFEVPAQMLPVLGQK